MFIRLFDIPPPKSVPTTLYVTLDGVLEATEFDQNRRFSMKALNSNANKQKKYF